MKNIPLFTQAPQSICLLRLSAIGDVTHAIAVAQAIEDVWPSTKITWIIGQLESTLIAPLLPHVNFIIFDKKKGWREYIRIWSLLKNQHFSALLHMQTALRASLITLGITADYKLGFDKIRTSDKQQWFTNVKVPSPSSPHVADGFMAFVRQLGINRYKPHWDIEIPDKAKQWVSQILPDTNKNILVIVPGASKAFKNWTSEGYVSVIEYAWQQGLQIVLAGSPHPIEVTLGHEIEHLLSQKASQLTNLIGQTSLLQMLALLKKAHMVISPDTGPAHMASMINTPVIGLYAHHDPQRVGPYNSPQYCVSIYQHLAEACTGKTRDQLSWRYRVKDPHAMQKITSQQVIAMLDKALKENKISC